MTGALRNRAFRWVALILTIDSLLEWFGSIALMTLVYQHTRSTTAAAGLLICKQIAPAVLVHLVAPHLDRLGVSRSLAAALVLQALTLAALATCGFGVPLFLLAVVTGAAGTLVRSMLRAATSLTLRGAELRAGNAAVNVAVALTSLIGPVLAAVAVSTVGARVALLLAAGLTLSCVLLAALVPAGSAAQAEADGDDERLRHPRTSAMPINWMLALSAVLFCILAMDEPTLLAYSERSLGAGVSGYGAIFATWGIGLTIGGFGFSRLLHVSMLQLALAAMALDAAAYVGLGLAPTIQVACSVAVLGGIGNGIGFVALATAVQEATPRGNEASSAARFQSISTAAPVIGIVAGGVLADIADPRVTLLAPGLLGLIVLAAGGLAVWSRQRDDAASSFLLTSSTPGGSV